MAGEGWEPRVEVTPWHIHRHWFRYCIRMVIEEDDYLAGQVNTIKEYWRDTDGKIMYFRKRRQAEHALDLLKLTESIKT